jgi:phosphotransferase system enzyme I (PtsI)
MRTERLNTGTHFKGLPISEGVAVARVCLFNEERHSNLAIYKVAADGIAGETQRVRQAIRLVTDQLDDVAKNVARRIGSAEAQIFEAQQAILADSVLVEEILEAIGTLNLNAEAAVTQTLDVYEARLSEVDNEYIRERASDIGEIRRRLLDVLADMNPSLECGDQEHCQQGHRRIIVAEELTPSLTVELDTEHTMGFVTERGGPTSHAAILARALGIPAVSGIQGIHSLLSCGTELLLDGDTGEVVIWPDEETVARARSGRTAVARGATVVEPVEGLTAMANISQAADVSEAVEHQAEGVGLYRTEFEFLVAGRILSEEEQLERYSAVVKAMDGRPVCFRLLDIGGDKGAPFFELPEEDNPYLGFRGSRLLLDRTDLLGAQARALARASVLGPVDVLYPMIVDREQFLKLKGLVLEAIGGMPTGRLRHGVMFEVPSACLEARELLEVAEFGSIGTNDLIQYLFAVDRNNERVAYDYTPDRPVFWSILGQIAEAAAQTGRSVSICGEAASNPRYLSTLVKLGLTTLSVSPRFIPELRLAARRHKKEGETSALSPPGEG